MAEQSGHRIFRTFWFPDSKINFRRWVRGGRFCGDQHLDTGTILSSKLLGE